MSPTRLHDPRKTESSDQAHCVPQVPLFLSSILMFQGVSPKPSPSRAEDVASFNPLVPPPPPYKASWMEGHSELYIDAHCHFDLMWDWLKWDFSIRRNKCLDSTRLKSFSLDSAHQLRKTSRAAYRTSSSQVFSSKELGQHVMWIG